jgi:MORN repeat protein
VKSALAALALAALAACDRSAPPGEQFVERFDNGQVYSIAAVIHGEQGERIREGPYTSFHENGEVEVVGQFHQGHKDGEWIAYWPNGFLRSQGRYADDIREGPWTMYNERGHKSAEGGFHENRRTGAWTWWREDGEIDEAHTGFYAYHVIPELDGERPTGAWWEGESFNRDKQGRWTLLRSNGTPILVGDYDRGRAMGPWLLFSADGSPDEGWVSGEYRDGARVGPLAKRPMGAKAQFETPDIARAAVPDAPAEALERVDAYLSALDSPDAAIAGQAAALRRGLLFDPRSSYPAILARLVLVDLAQPRGDARARQMCAVLAQMCGAALPWSEGSDDASRLANHRTVLRWYSLWELLRARERTWSRDLLPQWRWAELEERFTVLADPAPPDEFLRAIPGPNTAPGVAPVQLAAGTRFVARTLGRKRLLKSLGGEGTEQALARALEWIAANQAADGSWDPGASEGDPRWGIGVTAECLLSLLGDAHTLDYGTHRPSVTRGLRYLVHAQDPSTGRAVEAHAESHYEQALALEALAEGACLSRLPALLQATVRARDHLLTLQSKDGSWSLDATSASGDPATTARAVVALQAAREAGIEVEEAAVRAALGWLDARTDIATGRVAPGEPARFAPEGEVAVTSLATLARIFSGQTPQRYRVLQAAEPWLAEHVPGAAGSGAPGSLEDACWGATAACQLGGATWSAWNDGLRSAWLGAQRSDGPLAGSVDPPAEPGVGLDGQPLGGGRLHATATFALALEAYFRFARPASDR